MPLTPADKGALIAQGPFKIPLTKTKKQFLIDLYAKYTPSDTDSLTLDGNLIDVSEILANAKALSASIDAGVNIDKDSVNTIVEKLTIPQFTFDIPSTAIINDLMLLNSALLQRSSSFSEIIAEIGAVAMTGTQMDPITVCNKIYNSCIMMVPRPSTCEADRQKCYDMVPTAP